MDLPPCTLPYMVFPFIEERPSLELSIPQKLLDRLMKWNPDIDLAQVSLLYWEAVTWNDGSLGAPMPGKHYTMALVPGFRLTLQHGHKIFHVHTNRALRSFAIPGYGFI